MSSNGSSREFAETSTRDPLAPDILQEKVQVFELFSKNTLVFQFYKYFTISTINVFYLAQQYTCYLVIHFGMFCSRFLLKSFLKHLDMSLSVSLGLSLSLSLSLSRFKAVAL